MKYSERAGRGLLGSLSKSLSYMKFGMAHMMNAKKPEASKKLPEPGTGVSMEEMQKGSFKCETWALPEDGDAKSMRVHATFAV